MGYRIAYSTSSGTHLGILRAMRFLIMLGLSFVLFLLFVKANWAEGFDLLQNAFSSMKKIISVSGIEGFAEQFQIDEKIAAAYAAFINNFRS